MVNESQLKAALVGMEQERFKAFLTSVFEARTEATRKSLLENCVTIYAVRKESD